MSNMPARFSTMEEWERDIMPFSFPVPDTSNIQKKPVDAIFPDRISKTRAHICITCGGKVEGFNDELSQKEFLLSGMCQKCQDEIFKEGD